MTAALTAEVRECSLLLGLFAGFLCEGLRLRSTGNLLVDCRGPSQRAKNLGCDRLKGPAEAAALYFG